MIDNLPLAGTLNYTLELIFRPAATGRPEQRILHRPELQLGLREFRLGGGAGHDPGARVHARARSVDEGRAQAHDELPGPPGVDPSERAAVQSPGKGLELGDRRDGQLPRVAADGGRRVQPAEHVEKPDSPGQLRLDGRVEVLDIGKAPEQGPGGVLEVQVQRRQSPQDRIEDDPLFPQVLLAVQEALSERRVLACRRSPARRPGEGLGEGRAPLDAEQELRARADEALAPSVRDGERVAVGEPLAKPVQHPQGMQRVRRPHVLRPCEDDLLELPPRDAADRPAHGALVAPAAAHFVHRRRDTGSPVRKFGRREVERAKLGMRPPDLGRKRIGLRIPLHKQVGDSRRAAVPARHLPAGDEHAGGLERLAWPHRVQERECREEMRAAEGDVLVADRDRAAQRLVDEPLARREAARARGREPEDRLGAGDRPPLGGPLGVEMPLVGLEDRLEDRQRVQVPDLDRDAHKDRAPGLGGGISALGQEPVERLGRGVRDGIDGKDGHGAFSGSRCGLGKSTSAGASLAPASRPPHASSSSQAPPGR